jgi:hypothetical protein
LDIFHRDYSQSEPARIFFNSDGTSDEAEIVLVYKGQRMRITLEYATGLPVVNNADQ